ncbi:MAG: methyltransferase domain-containing protein [Rhodospirillaceae bacterium]|nr:methyltransferase domain-containing protein [Rhodospirillaceae bacterium]
MKSSGSSSFPGKRNLPLTLGPLADLEGHLPGEWWRDLFTSLYLKTDGDVVENLEATRNEVDLLISTTGIRLGDRILDLCCGQGRHVIELAQRGFSSVSGIDRSRYLIRTARKRARKLGLSVSFREGDARFVRVPTGSLDAICMMGNSFGYFESEDDDRQVLQSVQKALCDKGTFAIDISDGEWMRNNFEPRSWEWIDQNQFVCRERTLSADGKRLISREVVTHAERGVIADQFYAERLYSCESIMSLLDEVGFLNVGLHKALKGESTRQQDLGMMAHRLFLTAEAPVKKTISAPMEKFLSVAVALGDPRLPDEVKNNGQFNEEDIDTVNRLKESLGKMPGYHFTYHDNHPTLLEELKSAKADFVFNLCDEGFGNEAMRELHVPAYLELMNIPYSGAGPVCLGTCYDKAMVRALALAHDIPVPLETIIRSGDHLATLPSIFPALLKPALGDSSIGITQKAVVHNANELVSYLGYLREILPNRAILVQEFLNGAEYSVTLIGNIETGLDALPILEVDFSELDVGLPCILGYESKWHPESPYWNKINYLETGADAEVQHMLIQYSSRMFEVMECRDYARFDFRADSNGDIKLLEVNPNPGWCWDGKVNLMAKFAGISYDQLLARILNAARQRLNLDNHADNFSINRMQESKQLEPSSARQ